MTNFLKLSALTLTTLSVLLLMGCEDKPAETTGEKVDNAIENAGDKIEDAGDNIDNFMDDTGNSIEDACEKTKEAAGVNDTDC